MTPINDIAISKIMKYIDEYCFEPGAKWLDEYFAQRSYSNWAAYEILELIMDHPFDSPSLLIDDFILKMELYSCIGNVFERKIIFSIAKDTAEHIQQLLFLNY